MPIVLSERQAGLQEFMDRSDCDPVLLENTYHQFSTINLLLSQWKKVYKKYLKPRLSSSHSTTLLDIGFGGGDIPLKLARWAAEDGLLLHITAIETDIRTLDYVNSLDAPENITFLHTSSQALVEEGRTFDLVISNHLMHHLEDEDLLRLMEDARKLSTQLVVFNDILRSDLGYLLFTTFSRLLFRKSFITVDGLISIKRSFTFRELRKLAPDAWTVHSLFPFRLLMIYE